jgi:hypothetical protein
MIRNADISDQILNFITKSPGCRMTDLIALFPDLAWNQLLDEVNRLRLGHRLWMTMDSRGSLIVSPRN